MRCQHHSPTASGPNYGRATVCVLLSLHLIGVSAGPSRTGSAAYFPEDLSLATEAWGSNFQRSMYATVLNSLDEPVLAGSGDRIVQQYRFVWLRSFHDYVVIRAVQRAGGSTIHVRVLHGFHIDTVDQDGTVLRYNPGEVVHAEDRPLSKEQWAAILEQVEASGFWELAPAEESKGVDGAEWLLEGATARGYHAVTRWSPKSGPFKEVCLKFLELAEADFGPVY